MRGGAALGAQRGWIGGALGVSLAGAAVSAYLLAAKLRAAPMFCLTGGGCEAVNASPYSEFLGIPVSAFGLVVYLVLAAAAAVWFRHGAEVSGWVPVGAFGLTLVGFLYSAYLTYIEAFVLNAYCSWCLTSFGLITAELALILMAMRQQDQIK